MKPNFGNIEWIKVVFPCLFRSHDLNFHPPGGILISLDGLIEMSSVEVRVEEDAARMRPSDVPVIYGDISKLKADTGWEPVVPFEESLCRVLAYWREVVQNPDYVPLEENR